MIQYDQYIHYSQAKHSEEFQRLHAKIKPVAFMASVISKILFDEDLVTDSIFRKKTTDSGIHEAYRAIDFAPLSHMEYTYLLIEKINEIYTYDYRVTDTPNLFSHEELEKRKHFTVADINPWHGTNCHIHIQVCDFTGYMTNVKRNFLLAQAAKDKANFKPQSLGIV